MEQTEFLGFMIYPYSLAAVLAGAALCLLWAGIHMKKAGISGKTMAWSLTAAPLLAALLARAGYCLCDYEWLENAGPEYLIQLGDGGWLPVTMLLGLTAGLLLASRLSRTPFGRLADAFAVPAVVYIALLHCADGLAGEGYGWGVNEWLEPEGGMSLLALQDTSAFQRFPFAIGNYYGEWRWAVFVLMAVLMAVLAVLTARAQVKRGGGRWTLALLLISCTEILGESLRQDEMIKWGFVRCSQLLYALTAAALLIVCWRMSGGNLLRGLLFVLGGAVLVILMEFALEGKISAIEWMTMDVCYCFSALGCALIAAGILPLWRKAFGIEAQN